MCNFKDYYKFPLKPMPGLELIKVLTDDNQMAFDWCWKLSGLHIKDRLLEINFGDYDCVLQVNPPIYSYKEGIVYRKDYQHIVPSPYIRIRGWGHLIGVGGLHLSENKAKEIQDAFGNYIVKQLNRHEDV